MGIRYKEKRTYKYILEKEERYGTGIAIPVPAYYGPLKMITDGTLIIDKGYAWDGPSGPTIDTKTFMRGSLIHNAMCQLIREGVLSPFDRHRADNILRDICLEDGMARLRAWYVYQGVRRFGAKSCRPDIITAP
jgi:hypothetical protein